MTEPVGRARAVTSKNKRVSTHGLLLFILPLPLLISFLFSLAKGEFTLVLANAFGAGLFLLGAMSTRQGLKKEAEFHEKTTAVASRHPFKLYGVVMITLATAITAWLSAGHNIYISILFALGALLGFLLTYGFDPRGEKGAQPTHGYTRTELIEALEEANERVRAIEIAREKIGNVELRERLSRIVEAARKVIKVIEDDPRDLRRARKFMKTYLEGAKKVAEGYAKTHAYADSKELENNFRNVLQTIEVVFEEQRTKLLENDVLDLDVQIEVLATQLKREGVV